MGTSTVPDRAPEILPKESVEPRVVADGNKLGWKYTASATAKLLLRGISESSDPSSPLSSLAGGLSFLLDNYEV